MRSILDKSNLLEYPNNRLTSQFIRLGVENVSPRPDVSEERKQQITDAAVRVFTRLGLHQARMDDIVEESGLSKGTLYWYFKSKDEIIIAILENLFSKELNSLQMPDDSTLTPSDRIEQFLPRSMEDASRLLRLLPLTYEFYAMALRNKPVRAMLTKYLREYMKNLVPVIQDGIDHGEFRQLEALDAAVALGAMFEGLLLLWMYDPETIDLDRHFQSCVDIFMLGLKVQPA